MSSELVEQVECDAATSELVPARMLNEFAYCPRLSYLEWVQGEWADNLETQEGTFGHRNVDRPGKSAVPEPPAADDSSAPFTPFQTIHARSVSLSAPRERLTAKLDLMETDGETAIPVDYKRGQAPDIPEGAYEPERVQLCAQGLILRENGFQCNHGVIYFIQSRRRVEVLFTDELIARTRQLVNECLVSAASNVIPPPLVESPKCPRCSLVGICLPDETNLLVRLSTGTETEQTEEVELIPPEISTAAINDFADGAEFVEPRPLFAVRNSAQPLYLQEQGTSLSKSGERLVVKNKGAEVQSIPLKDVSQLSLFGGVYVTEPAVREIVQRGIPVCHLSYGGWFYAMTTGLVHKNIELRIRQFALAANPAESVKIARQMISGKVRNCRTLLRRNLESADKARLLMQLADLVEKINKCESLESLLGLEGTAARIYFSGFKQLLTTETGFDLEARNRRPPRDPVNAILSFLYAILTKELTVTLQAVGFDPLRGVFHQPRYGKPALALDLAEEFRPLIADSTALLLINTREIDQSSFISRAGTVALTDSGRKAVLTAFERRMESEVKHPIFGYRLSYRRLLELQARLLSRVLFGEIAQYPAFFTR